MFDFDELKEKTEYIFREKPVLFWVTVLILIFFLFALIILFIQTAPEKIQPVPEIETVQLKNEPFTPDEPQIEKDYYLSRKKETNWDKTEAEQYFSEPDEKMMAELEKTNDAFIREITGVAP